MLIMYALNIQERAPFVGKILYDIATLKNISADSNLESQTIYLVVLFPLN